MSSVSESSGGVNQNMPDGDPEEARLVELLAVPPTAEYLRRMWEKRDFITALPVEQLRSSHQTTLLGNLWHLGNPALSIIVYYVIFGVVLQVSRGIDNFTLFLVVGVFVYRNSSGCLAGGARSVTTNAGLMRSFRFPRAVLPISHVLSELMTFGFELSIVAAFALATGEGVTRRWLLLPLAVLIQTIFNLGGAFLTARLNDSVRDVEQLIPFVMRLLMYASGVMFSVRERVTNAPGWIQQAVRWNPFAALLDIYRWIFMGRPVGTDVVVRLVVISVLVLVIGYRYFVANETNYGRG